jgi:hypothetical protein
MEVNTEALLTVPIKDEEIFELLERLAATEEMFKTPVSTIRDVAELTEASPNLIARILGEMRGPDEIEKLTNRVDLHEARLRWVESKIIAPATTNPAVPPVTDPQASAVPPVVQPQSLVWSNPKQDAPTNSKSQATEEDWDRYRKWISEEMKIDPYERERNSRRTQTTVGVVVIVLIILTWTAASVMESEASRRHLPPPYEQQVDSRIFMEKN